MQMSLHFKIVICIEIKKIMMHIMINDALMMIIMMHIFMEHPIKYRCENYNVPSVYKTNYHSKVLIPLTL